MDHHLKRERTNTLDAAAAAAAAAVPCIESLFECVCDGAAVVVVMVVVAVVAASSLVSRQLRTLFPSNICYCK